MYIEKLFEIELRKKLMIKKLKREKVNFLKQNVIVNKMKFEIHIKLKGNLFIELDKTCPGCFN